MPPEPQGIGNLSANEGHGVAGRGISKKRTPFCNGADRGLNVIPV